MRALMHILLSALFAVTEAQAAPAHQDCRKLSSLCIESGGARMVEGRNVIRPCWGWREIYDCKAPGTPRNTCAALAATPGCSQTSSICHRRSNGVCLEHRKTHQCGSRPANRGGAVLLDSEYTVTRDALVNNCTAHERDANCALASAVCVEPGGTRNINGLNVTKDCWSWRREYNCLASNFISDCTPHEADPACSLTETECMSSADNGICTHTEKRYNCAGEPGGVKPATCGSANWCVGGNCESRNVQANRAFGKAAAAMSVMGEMGADFDGASVFAGTERTCRKWVLSLKNCCANDGLLLDAGLGGCSEDEQTLAVELKAGQAHHTRSWCARKVPIAGTCIVRKRAFCSFKSRLGRIVQENARGQLNIDWDTCRGLTPEELTRVDWSRVDLSEALPDIHERMTEMKKEQTVRAVRARVEGFYDDVRAERRDRLGRVPDDDDAAEEEETGEDAETDEGGG